MLRLRPISEKDTSGKVKAIYKEIKDTLAINFVPLIFQYIANYEEYLIEVWEHIKENMNTHGFRRSVIESTQFAEQAIDIIYSPSEAMKTYSKEIQVGEQNDLLKTAEGLMRVNATLLVVSLALREGIKGLVFEEEIDSKIKEEHILKSMSESLQKEDAKLPESSLLPLLGLAVGFKKYQSFFSLLEDDMERLKETEAYLRTRVEIERIDLSYTKKFPKPISYSYWKIARLIGDRKYFHEMIYLLKIYFPTQIPSLFLTSVAMKKAIVED